MNWEKTFPLAPEQEELYLQLQALTGYPARVTLKCAEDGQPLKIPGILERVVVTGVHLDLQTPVGHLEPNTPVHLEISSKHALVRCDTTVEYNDISGRLSLTLPKSIDIVQRRRHPRADVQLEAHLQLYTEDEPMPIQIINLSTGGAAYSTNLQHSPGSRVLLHMTGLGLSPADIPARVVRCTPIDSELWVIGVAFQLMSPAQEARLAQYVATVLNEPS